MASEGNKIQRNKELLNRHIPYRCSMAFFQRQKYLRNPITVDICTQYTKLRRQVQYNNCLRYITRKSSIKNTSVVPFANLASMLLSVQTVKSNRGIPSIAWINDDKQPSFPKVAAASFINQLFRTGRSRTLHVQILRPVFCSKNFQKRSTFTMHT